MPLIVGGLVSGGLIALGGLAPSALALGAILVLAGAASSLVSIAGTVSVFHSFPAERRGIALGLRQMSVAGGGLIAAILLPTLAHLGGVGLALAVSGVLAGVTAVAFGLASPRGALGDHADRRRIAPREVFTTPGMRTLLLVGLLQVAVLTTVLVFSVPAARALGWSAVEASALFVVVSLSAMAARVTFGRIADRAGGTRRRATLRDIGLLACGGAILYAVASPHGVAWALPAMAVFAFGALGFNGVLYVIAGELSGPDRAGQAVALGATVLFGGSALSAIPLGMLADAAGYQALWPAAAVLAALGVCVTTRLPG